MSPLPQDLRPAQLGLLLTGRPLVAHVAATAVDLAGHEPVEEFEVDVAAALAGEHRGEALADFRRHLVISCVRAGLLQHLHHDRLTDAGDERLAAARALRTALRAERPLVSPAALPWAVALGVVPVDSEVCGGRATAIAAAARALPEWQHAAGEPEPHWQRQQPDKAMGVWTLSAGLRLRSPDLCAAETCGRRRRWSFARLRDGRNHVALSGHRRRW